MSTETKDALLARLLELPESERAEYLKQVCASAMTGSSDRYLRTSAVTA